MNNQPGKKARYLTVASGAFILMLFALYGNFPVLTSDSGAYISSGFMLQVPADRPIFYGLFIRLTSLGVSVWLTVFVQCLLLSYVLCAFIRKLLPRVTNTQLLGFILFTSLFTICGWFTGQLMPDIFTAVMILATTSYLLFDNTRYERVGLMAVVLLSALMHNSNFLVLAMFTVLFFLFAWMRGRVRMQLAKVITLSCICIASWLAFCTSNLASGHGFTASRSTHVFIMGKLVESGVLKTYLEKACPLKNYNICKYKDALPPVAWEFHWDANSPLQQTGGWEANRQEYNTIIRDIFSRPKYYPYIVYKAIEATARQLTQLNIDGVYSLPWMKFDEETPPYKAIEQYFPHELNQLKTSRQNTKTYQVAFYDGLFTLVFVLSCIAVLFTLGGHDKRKFYSIIGCIGVFIVLNAFVTAVLSSVNARFNARVSWLVPFINMVMLFKFIVTYVEQRNVIRHFPKGGVTAGDTSVNEAI